MHHCSVFLPLTLPKLASVSEGVSTLSSLKSYRAGIKQFLGWIWVQREWVEDSWRARSKLTPVLDAREGKGPTSGDNREGPSTGCLDTSLSLCLIKVTVTPSPAPFLLQSGSHGSIIFCQVFILLVFIDLESRTNTLNAPAHLCPYFSLNCMRKIKANHVIHKLVWYHLLGLDVLLVNVTNCTGHRHHLRPL